MSCPTPQIELPKTFVNLTISVPDPTKSTPEQTDFSFGISEQTDSTHSAMKQMISAHKISNER